MFLFVYVCFPFLTLCVSFRGFVHLTLCVCANVGSFDCMQVCLCVRLRRGEREETLVSRFSERLVIPTFYASKKLGRRKDIARHICVVAKKRKYRPNRSFDLHFLMNTRMKLVVRE